jgi:hypothetical protein
MQQTNPAGTSEVENHCEFCSEKPFHQNGSYYQKTGRNLGK